MSQKNTFNLLKKALTQADIFGNFLVMLLTGNQLFGNLTGSDLQANNVFYSNYLQIIEYHFQTDNSG